MPASIPPYLLDAAQRLVGERGYEQTLLICPRSTTSGAAFAAQRGAGLAHSEHALQLTGAPIPGPKDAAVSLRAATADDASTIARLLQAGFGYPAADVAQRLVEDRARNLVVERAGTTVGYLRLSLDGTVGGVYGFVIDPPLQGHGIGRDVLHRACLMLRELGATHVGLEVGVTNERALGLYTSLGFVRVSTEDYFHLPPSLG